MCFSWISKLFQESSVFVTDVLLYCSTFIRPFTIKMREKDFYKCWKPIKQKDTLFMVQFAVCKFCPTPNIMNMTLSLCILLYQTHYIKYRARPHLFWRQKRKKEKKREKMRYLCTGIQLIQWHWVWPSFSSLVLTSEKRLSFLPSLYFCVRVWPLVRKPHGKSSVWGVCDPVSQPGVCATLFLVW